MLFETLSQPKAAVNLGLLTAVLPDDLDVPRYQAAWAACIARHQSLRSHFLWEGLSAPVLVIREEAPLNWEMPDWRDLGRAEREAVLTQWRHAGLPLDTAPVLRISLARLEVGYQLIFACHHALLDDWSMDLVLGEVEALYHTQPLEPAMAFRDYADWLAERAAQEDSAFWANRLEGVEAPTRLAFGAPEMAAPDHAPHVAETLTLSVAETQALQETARALRVTLAAVLSAVWSLVVSRISDSSDVTLGLATTQRVAELEGAQSAVGNFVATVPLRLRVDPHETLRARILARAAETLAEQGRAAPLLAELVQGAQSGDAPFDTILSIKESGLAGYAHALHQDQQVLYHSSFALAMIMRPGDALSLTALADPNTLGPDARRQVLQMTRAALQAVPSALDHPCVTLPMGQDSRAPLRGVPLPADRPLIPYAIAAQDPSNIAILQEGQPPLSYSALEARVASLAAQLSAHGVAAGDRVGVLFPRGADAIAAFLAVWRIGAAYVPLDPDSAQDRLTRMTEIARLRCVLAHPAQCSLIPDALPADVSFSGEGAAHPTRGQDVAYVMFTSGSTGQPKGVVISHDNLSASAAARPLWYKDHPERYLVVSPFGFDSSVAGIYWTLSQGGTLVLPTAETVQDPRQLAHLIAQEQVTHTLCLPSLYDLILDAAAPGALASLRCTIVAGEACPTALVARHHRERPGTRLINEYGPTEATVWCVAADLQDIPGAVPIGSAIPGVTLDILDAQGQPVPPGLPGLLHVSGPGVTAGYFEAPALSAEVLHEREGVCWYNTGDLVRQGAEGQIFFLGRRDDQVKIRGQRIELGEVEARLLEIPGVTAAATVAVPQAGRLTLIAYLCGGAQGTPLQDQLRSRLAGASLPSHVVVLEDMPRTATGKLDRKALQARGIPAAGTTRTPPDGAVEQRLAALWQDRLDLPDTPDVLADFFALGGDSLLAMRLVGEVAEAFEHPLQVADMMRAGLSIRSMAQLLTQPRRAPQAAHGWPAPANASQKAMWLAARMNPGVPFFHLTLAARVARPLSRDILVTARDALAHRHDVLRCRFRLQDRALTLVEDAPQAQVSMAAHPPADLDKALAQAVTEPFDMSGGALWRLHAYPQEDGETVVQLVIHHTISDGWSMDILMRDLFGQLSGEPCTALPPEAGFAAALHAAPPPRSDSLAFWQDLLPPHGAARAQLPMDHPVPNRSDGAGALHAIRLSVALSQRVKAYAQDHETSVFVLLWAALGHTLHQITDQTESLVAVSHANRHAADHAQTVGCFTKALPYVLEIAPDDFAASLRRAKDRAHRIMVHGDVGPEDLDLPAGTGGPGYLSSFAQIALQYNDFERNIDGPPNVTPLPFKPQNTSVFELSLAWSWQGDQLECHLLARRELFAGERLDALLQTYEAVLERHLPSQPEAG